MSQGEYTEAELEKLWDNTSADPHLNEDLGYEMTELDILETSNTVQSGEKVMVLPQSDEQVEEDAYIIADYDMAVDPLEYNDSTR